MGPPRGKLIKRVLSPTRRVRDDDMNGQGSERLHLQAAVERRSKTAQDLRAVKGKGIARSPADDRKRKAVAVESDSSSDDDTGSAEDYESEEEEHGNR